MALYDGVNGVSREVAKKYDGVGGVAREVVKAYDGVNGVAREYWCGGTPISEFPVGDSVYINVNGVSTEFLIVHQGLPSSVYDGSCDGTWLLMKDIYETRIWYYTNNDYQKSTIHTYLNNDFFELFDAGIQDIIKQVKIPYINGVGNAGSYASGSDGLSAKIFLLSGTEVGWGGGNPGYLNTTGFCLDYFSGTAITDSKRIAYYNGKATIWSLRSPRSNGNVSVWCVDTNGAYTYSASYYSNGVRPTFILPSDTLVDENLNILTD